MKKTLLLVLSVLLLFAVGCSTARVPETINSSVITLEPGTYEVLGNVELTSTNNNIMFLFEFGGKGYDDLLEKAKSIYAECDDVVNVHVEQKGSLYLGVYNYQKRVISGTAVKYL